MNRRNFLTTTAAGLGSLSIFPLLATTVEANIPSVPPAIEWINNNIYRFDRCNFGTSEFVPLKLNGVQTSFINRIETTNSDWYLTNYKRQVGYTTASAAYLLYRMIHDSNSTFMFIGINSMQSGYFMDLVRDMYKRLSNKIPMSVDNKYEINIGSNILLATTHGQIDTKVCGYTIKLAISDEYYYDNRYVSTALESHVDRIVGYRYIGNE